MMVSRRHLIVGAITVASAAVTGEIRAQRKLKVVVAGGHPGDPEYGCGGTVARYADTGHDVVLLYLNRGEKSCPETPAAASANFRVREAGRACEILQARPLFAGQCDGHAIVDSAHYMEQTGANGWRGPPEVVDFMERESHPGRSAWEISRGL